MTEASRKAGAIGTSDMAAALAEEVRSTPDRLAFLQGKQLYKAIALAFLAALVFRFFDPISRVLLIAFVGVVVAMALNAVVTRIPIRRGLATIVVAVGLFTLIGIAVWAAGRWLLPQLSAFLSDLPDMRNRVEAWEAGIEGQLGVDVEMIGGITEMLLEDPAGTVMSLMSRAFGILEILGLSILVLFGAIFAVARPNDQLLNPLLRTIPPEKRPAFRRMLGRMAARLVGWLRGTVISMLIIGGVSALAFWVIGVPYSLLLGAWVGFIEILPIVGPWIGGITVALVTLAFEPALLLWVAIAILAIQQIEGNLVQPFVMSGAAELHPFVTLMGLLLFGTIFGLLGALLALPILLAIGTAIEVFWVEETIETANEQIAPMVGDPEE